MVKPKCFTFYRNRSIPGILKVKKVDSLDLTFMNIMYTETFVYIYDYALFSYQYFYL